MNEKRIRTARLIRLGLFIAVWFSVLYMFRWEIGTPAGRDRDVNYIKLDRWTGTSYHCGFRPNATNSAIRDQFCRLVDPNSIQQ